jgi:hypothetical protein
MVLPVIFSAASLIISGLSFVILLGYLRRRTGAKRILEDFEEEVNRIIAGMDAAADRNITLLEDRSAAIKSMLDTLDRRIAAYARELERREQQDTALDALSPRGAGAPGSGGVLVEGAYAALGRGIRSSLRVDAPEPPAAPPGSLDTGDAAEAAGPAEPSGPAAETQPRFELSATPVKPKLSLAEQARELRRNGFSPETIAARLGSTQAEINLALALSEGEWE